MSRRLDIGCLSYRSPEKLRRTLADIERHSVTDWRCLIVHNPAPDDGETREVIADSVARNSRFVPVRMRENVGYAGGVNELFARAETEYIAYLDCDAYVHTPGWDEKLASYLDRFHEIGCIFPNEGHYSLSRPGYTECLWAAGFCWMLPRLAQRAVGLMDTSIGHHEEVDFCTRLRLAGYRLACAPEVAVAHDETSTRSPESQERINRGVVAWMNKWCAYFGGKGLNYHSPNVIRVTDWPIHALYLEEWYQRQLPGLNDNPETVMVGGVAMDLIKVPKPSGFYRGRVI